MVTDGDLTWSVNTRCSVQMTCSRTGLQAVARVRSGPVRHWATQHEMSFNAMSWNHPETFPPPWPVEKLPTTKLLPGV